MYVFSGMTNLELSALSLFFPSYNSRHNLLLKSHASNIETSGDLFELLRNHNLKTLLKTFEFIKDPVSEVRLELERMHQKNLKLISYGDPLYPKSFYDLEFPPTFLSLQGSPCWVDKTCLSIVGSRGPSVESIRWMDMNLPKVLNNSLVTVSGGAIGVDQAAHFVSLRMKSPTVVILPCGLDSLYPHNLENIRERVVDYGGCLMSELALKTEVKKHYFHHRNRMIAKIANVLFVVEARRRSGTSMTARLAMENNITIGAMPGPVHDINFLGSLDLINQGAFLIRDYEDLNVLINSTLF